MCYYEQTESKQKLDHGLHSIGIIKIVERRKPTSGNISTFLPAAISNAYIFMSAVIAYAFKISNGLCQIQDFKDKDKQAHA